MPARRDMDPLDIPHLLANIVLFDVEFEPLRFRVRLCGTTVAEIRGWDFTGRYLDEPGTSRIADLTSPANEQIVATRKPHFMDAPYPLESEKVGHFYRLGLPFSEDGQRVTMILSGFIPEQQILAETRAKTITA